MLIIVPIVILFLLSTFAPDFTFRNLSTIIPMLTPFVLVGCFLTLRNLVNGVHDGIIARITKTKWVKIKETDEYTVYADADNNNDQNSNHSNGFKFVNKEEYLRERNSTAKLRGKLYKADE